MFNLRNWQQPKSLNGLKDARRKKGSWVHKHLPCVEYNLSWGFWGDDVESAHPQISLVWLVPVALNTHLHFTGLSVHRRSWPSLTVVGHGVCAGQKRQLRLWLWSLHSGRAHSQALASLGSPGDRRLNYKNLFLCRRAEEQGRRDGTGELWWEFLKLNP